MKNENINQNGLGSLDFANLTQEELETLHQIEKKINSHRQDKVVLMALTQQDMK
jgi:hypothetical protein